jgi:hypothetical protein
LRTMKKSEMGIQEVQGCACRGEVGWLLGAGWRGGGQGAVVAVGALDVPLVELRQGQHDDQAARRRLPLLPLPLPLLPPPSPSP